nr:unnamed protein product [Callosobruchus chinensis]
MNILIARDITASMFRPLALQTSGLQWPARICP